MELIIDTFIIFSCLMFWIVFQNKKGLLSEIKKTEKNISEKIVVLEDLLDSYKNLTLSEKNDDKKTDVVQTPEDNIESQRISTSFSFKDKDVSEDSITELRVLSLEDASKTIIENEQESRIENENLYSSDFHQSDIHQTHPKFESQRVKDIIQVAKKNLAIIENQEKVEFKNFKDIVQMSKQLESSSKLKIF